MDCRGAQERHDDAVPLYLADDRLQEPLLFKKGFYQMVPNQSAGWSGDQARMKRADDP
jgi:hypothetical protein